MPDRKAMEHGGINHSTSMELVQPMLSLICDLLMP